MDHVINSGEKGQIIKERLAEWFEIIKKLKKNIPFGNYELFLIDVFCNNNFQSIKSTNMILSEKYEDFRNHYLERINIALKEFPKDKGNVISLVDKILSDDLSDAIRFLNFEEKKEIDKYIEIVDLKPRKKKILKLRYGLQGNKRHELKELRKEFNISYDRVRQIIDSSIKELLIINYRSTDKILECLFGRQHEVENLREIGRVLSERINDRLISVDENDNKKTVTSKQLEKIWWPVLKLNLSNRALNILKNQNIEYVWQLVIKSESDLLRAKNAGIKTLNEITQILHNEGLRFDMKLDQIPPPKSIDI